MAKRGSSERDNGEIEFTRAATDAVLDVSTDLGMEHLTRMHLTSRRGVLEYQVLFFHPSVGQHHRVVVSVSQEWPNANGNSYGAFFFQLCQKATLMARAWHINWQEEERARG